MREAAERRQQLELEHEQALAALNAKQQEIDLLQKVSRGARCPGGAEGRGGRWARAGRGVLGMGGLLAAAVVPGRGAQPADSLVLCSP